MKSLLVLVSLLVSSVAFADQCQLVDEATAARAKLLLKNNSEIVFHCAPCGDKAKGSKVTVVRSLKTGTYAGYTNFTLNNNKNISVDLAYTYVKVAPNMFVNVAKVVGCEAVEVPNQISL